ncbi:unnamed protein product [Calypogeia fissa]
MGQLPHPLAGKTGEGAPVAPPKWKWRYGNRVSDMYFYSPEGKKFRSRVELASYLNTLSDGPSQDDFCWRPTEEILRTGVWIKVSSSEPAKTQKSKAKNVDTEKPAKRAKQSDRIFNGSPQIQSPSAIHNGVQFSQVEPLAIRAPGPVLSKKVTTGTPKSRLKRKAKRNETKVKVKKTGTEVKAKKTEIEAKSEKPATIGSHTFKEILAEPSSFTWLFDPHTMEKFREEAKKLNDLSATEISGMRKLLVERNPQMGNMSKYPNEVLKVFLRLLGTNGLSDEPSDTLGKVELASLCVKLAKA